MMIQSSALPLPVVAARGGTPGGFKTQHFCPRPGRSPSRGHGKVESKAVCFLPYALVFSLCARLLVLFSNAEELGVDTVQCLQGLGKLRLRH